MLDANVAVALEVILVRPRSATSQKGLVEYEPQRTPLRYLTYDGLLFTSGETQDGATLADQVTANLAVHAASLAMAGLSWEHAQLVSCFLRRDHSVDALRTALARPRGSGVPVECELVDGFAGEGRLVEIEVRQR